MATHAATRNISGLARALAQQGLMSEYEAETLQTQAQAGGVSFVEQVLIGKRMTAQQLAVFASRAFGAPLLDLASFDTDHLHKDYIDIKIAQTRRVLPLYKRNNKLYVALSDPANLQGLDEVRFKTNLVPEPIVVEDDKLGQAIAKFIEGTGTSLTEMGNLEDMEVGLEDGAPSAVLEDEAPGHDRHLHRHRILHRTRWGALRVRCGDWRGALVVQAAHVHRRPAVYLRGKGPALHRDQRHDASHVGTQLSRERHRVDGAAGEGRVRGLCIAGESDAALTIQQSGTRVEERVKFRSLETSIRDTLTCEWGGSLGS
jgi:hypothetical protein